jgi:RNA polymerase sigma-70 factor (ECF subfamily)
MLPFERMGSPSDNAALLSRIREDAPGAFEEFVGRFGGRIYAFGMKFCGEREDAKDVLQDTLLQAYRSLRELDNPGAMTSWLYRVAANACLMKRRKGKFEPERELSLEELMPSPGEGPRVEIPDPNAMPHDEAVRAETAARVRKAIGDLPPAYRIVLVMRDMEQLTTQEVADALGLEIPAVKMRLHRARLMVRKSLEAEFATNARVKDRA